MFNTNKKYYFYYLEKNQLLLINLLRVCRGFKLKLLIDIRSLGRTPSGVGIYAYNFIKALNTYEDVQIDLVSDVAESKQINELMKLERTTLHLYEKTVSKTFAVVGYFKYVQKIIYKVKPDFFWEVNNLIPIKLKNPYGKKIVTIHDMFPLYMRECYGKIYPSYFKYGIRNTLRQVDGIIYNSEETKKETEKYFPKAREIQGIILYIIIESKNNLEIIDKNYFLYIGNLEKRKGTDILLKAYREYRKSGGTKKLLLAGKFRESDVEELYHQIKKENGGLEYLGYVEDSEKEQLLAECSCFVFPSRAEGFGIPIIEAILKNKPIIITDLSIFKETIGDLSGMVHLDDNAVENLTKAMLKEETWTCCNRDIALRYNAENLGRDLYLYFCSGREH